MSSTRRWSLGVLAPVALSAACSFLLDFDTLSSGGGAPDAGSTGNAGTSGQAGSNGQAGAGNGGCDCDDGDPCTDDTCDAQGECQYASVARIVEDGFSQTVSGPSIYQSALVAGEDRFYVAVYGDLAGGQDIAFYDLPSEGAEWTVGPRALELADFGDDVPISAPALVYDSTANELTAYFATGPANPSSFFNAGRVQRAVLGADLQGAVVAPVSADANYRYLNNTVGPAAAQVPGGEPFVAWPGSPPPGAALTSGIYLQTGATALPTAATPQLWEPRDLRGVAPIYGLGNGTELGKPGAVWLVQRAAGEVDTHLQLLDGLQQTFTQCVNAGVQGITVATSRAHTDGFWYAAWTKRRGPSYSTEALPIVCLGPGLCLFGNMCGRDQAELATVRNIQLVTYHRLSDPNDVAHQALALSAVDEHDRAVGAARVPRCGRGHW
jgi:hypothetical protein